MPSNKASERIVETGERYMVQWRNGVYVPGDVIEMRLSKKYKQSQILLEKANDKELKPCDYEYYIHYPNFDRRLDEWVTYDRIDLQKIVVGSDDNQKLKKTSCQTSTISKRKYSDYLNAENLDKREDKEVLLARLEKEHEEITKVKNINTIALGKYLIDTWYYSPYPDEYCNCDEKLIICEFCLKYMRKETTLSNHLHDNCKNRSPPGKEIYRENELSMFEIDGRQHKIYCQNLCLLSKLFLDHKTLYYDVDPFMFYVLCEVDATGAHIVGYFSKEKHSLENYNLACILTFPPYQRKGYGKLLISISYELTKRENNTGSPEKPLSDLGKISYRSYWSYIILKFFNENKLNYPNITINDISRATGIRYEDIISTLHTMNLIRFWKGQHVLKIQEKDIEMQLSQAKKIRLCDSNCLVWQPPEKPGPSKKSLGAL